MSVNGTILVVDDEYGQITWIGPALKQIGLEVLCSQSSSEAYDRLKNNAVSLVLLDWDLKETHKEGEDRTGLELVRFCKAFDPRMAVIVMSGAHTMDARADALSAGATSFLEKPFSLQLLCAHIAYHLGVYDAKRKVVGIVNLQRKEDIVSLEKLKAWYVSCAVKLCNGNHSEAALLLDVHRHTISTLLDSL